MKDRAKYTLSFFYDVSKTTVGTVTPPPGYTTRLKLS